MTTESRVKLLVDKKCRKDYVLAKMNRHVDLEKI